MTITINLDLKNEELLNEVDKNKLSFLVTKVFEEYIEDLQDEKLRKEIQKSKELDSLLSNIKL